MPMRHAVATMIFFIWINHLVGLFRTVLTFHLSPVERFSETIFQKTTNHDRFWRMWTTSTGQTA